MNLTTDTQRSSFHTEDEANSVPETVSNGDRVESDETPTTSEFIQSQDPVLSQSTCSIEARYSTSTPHQTQPNNPDHHAEVKDVSINTVRI